MQEFASNSPPGRNGSTRSRLHAADGDDHVSKALSPALTAFLADALAAITRALLAVLPHAWTEGWVLGQLASQAVLSGLDKADWAGWTPGDYAAAQAIAGDGLSQLLAQADVTVKSIAETRIGELAAVLEAALASDETTGPVTLSVGSLARQLEDVLDDPSRAELVAWTEICRAQSAAAEDQYRQAGVTMVDLSTAHDPEVCFICQAVADKNPHPIGSVVLPLHPRERCALLPAMTPAVAG